MVFECPKCGSLLSGLDCGGCRTHYETVLDIPFIGEFEAEDVLGLIEIAANAPNRANLTMPVDEVERLDALCAAYHAATDKLAFKASNEQARVFYFDSRYSEWLAISNLLEGVDLAGRDVLDIGAGQGFDAKRLSLRGARVTALEFSPILAEAGKRAFPNLNWVGGFGHAVPFPTASFDFVFINAALHHMRNIPGTIAEALRVLRPGGMLITSGDSFCSIHAGSMHEFDVFDRHEAVLSGINEQSPPISELFAPLESNREILETEIFSQTIYGGRSGTGPDLTEWTAWDLDRDGDLLKQRGGCLAIRVRLKAPWPHGRLVQGPGVLSPGVFATWLDVPDTVIARLARLIPRNSIDESFPGRPSKFDMLNGWRVARSTDTTRTAFRRGRLFRIRQAGTKTLRFEMRSPVPTDIAFFVNAQRVGDVNVGVDWTKATIDISYARVDEVFVLEFRREGQIANFDESCFEVRLPVGKLEFKDILWELAPHRLLKGLRRPLALRR